MVSSEMIYIENKTARLTVGADGSVKSLILLADGKELLDKEEPCTLFSVTQERPFNNEVKLAHPNKRTTYPTRKLERDNADPEMYHVFFETVPVKANVRIRVTEWYFSFTLESFTVLPEDYNGILITPPPVCTFRLLALPVLQKSHFGEWLNIMWDETAAVCVCSATPYLSIDSETRRNGRILYAEALAETGLKDRPAVLITCSNSDFEDAMAQVEEDFDLPRGVKSRRDPLINASIYWTAEATLSNIDEHIRYAKEGGFRLMLFYYTSFFFEHTAYALNGNYDYRTDWMPNGKKDLITMLEKVRAAGIIPGVHFLQTHIGLCSRYCTPKADPRLNLKRIVTLAKPLTADSSDCGDIEVLSNPSGSEMADGARILKFGTELITYEGYSSDKPYRYTGCKRGDHGTDIVAHPAGEMGGVLDVSEFGGTSCYIDQNTDLQDEIADKIADFYDAGFSFIYFDGSEGTNVPFGIHVPDAQYKVYKKLKDKPIFCEGAAKAHFSWHHLSGGNAFDIFPSAIFKEKILEFPFAEAAQMACDKSRLNFGWWAFRSPDTQPDQFEFGTSRAAAWNCPATIISNLFAQQSNARTADIMAVMRRWEKVREKNLLTEEQRQRLRDPEGEYHLLENETGALELVRYEEDRNAAGGNADIRVFFFERNGEPWVVYWHRTGEGTCKLPLPAGSVSVYETLESSPLILEDDGGSVILPVGGMRYLRGQVTREKLENAFEKAVLS